MTSSFDPDDVEKFLPAIANVARAGLGAAKAGAKAAGKAASATAGAAKTGVGKVADAAKTAGSNIKEGVGELREQASTAMQSGTPENKKSPVFRAKGGLRCGGEGSREHPQPTVLGYGCAPDGPPLFRPARPH